MKRFISILLAAIMLLGSSAAAYAAVSSGEEAEVSHSYKTTTLQGYADSSVNPYDSYGLRLRYKMPNYLGTVSAVLETTEGTAQSDVIVLYVPDDKWDGDCYYSGLTATVRNSDGYYFFSGAESIIAWKDLYNYGFFPVSGGAYVYDKDAVQLNFLSGPGVYTAYATVPFSLRETGTDSYVQAMENDPESVLMTAFGFPFVLILNDKTADYFLKNGTLEPASRYTWPGLAELLLSCRYEMSESAGSYGLRNFTDKEVYYRGKLFDLIEDNSWYVPFVEKVYSLGLMAGYKDGCFRPEGDITLAEVITIAAKICDIYHGGSGEFTSGDTWYSAYVNYAVKKGIIREKDFDDFTRKATRGEIAYILSGVLPQEEYGRLTSIGYIKDLYLTTAYYDSIVKLYEAGIVSGYSDDTFAPAQNISRAELAAIIVKLLDPAKRSIR